MTGGGEEAALGGVVGGAAGVGGRKEELISPIPIKKSSTASDVAYHSTQGQGQLTRYNLDEVGTVTPYVLSIVDDYHHTLICREQSLQVLGCKV